MKIEYFNFRRFGGKVKIGSSNFATAENKEDVFYHEEVGHFITDSEQEKCISVYVPIDSMGNYDFDKAYRAS